MPRLLIFSPYALWTFHTTYESTIAKACQVRGASVDYLLCDGLLPECDQHWDSKVKGPRPADLCRRCQEQAKSSLHQLGMPSRWLGEFVSEAEKTNALAWAQSALPAQLRAACYQGLPLGEWVLSSVISYFREYPPDITNSHVVDVYRGFLYGSALVAIGIRHYLEQKSIDAAIVFNGRQSITRVALELLRQHGIRVITHERAEYERGHLNVRPNAHCMSPEPFQKFWSPWAQVPLRREDLEAALKWLIQRRYGANLAWIPFNTSFVRDSALRKKLNLSPQKRLWALFTSSTDEVAGDPLMQGGYASQFSWVRDVVQWVNGREDVELIIKVHPNLGGNSYIGKAVAEVQLYQDMKPHLPENVRIIMPEDAINAYSLADEADVGLTFGSTIGLEMAMLGKPIVLASRAIYQHGSRILKVQSPEELPQTLERCLHATIDREIQREAFRLAYYYIFVFERPFPAVQVLDVYESRPNYMDARELRPGVDGSLDRICRFLIEGEPLFETPDPADRIRTAAEEDIFFDELANSPEYLKNVGYERLQKWQKVGRSLRGLLLRAGARPEFVESSRRKWRRFLSRMESRV